MVIIVIVVLVALGLLALVIGLSVGLQWAEELPVSDSRVGKGLAGRARLLSIHMDNWRCVSVCLELLGVLCVFPPHFVTFASGYCWANTGWSWDGGAQLQLTRFTVSVCLEDDRRGSGHSSSLSSSSPTSSSSSPWQDSGPAALVAILRFHRLHTLPRQGRKWLSFHITKHKESEINGSTAGGNRKRTSTLGKFSRRPVRSLSPNLITLPASAKKKKREWEQSWTEVQ